MFHQVVRSVRMHSDVDVGEYWLKHLLRLALPRDFFGKVWNGGHARRNEEIKLFG